MMMNYRNAVLLLLLLGSVLLVPSLLVLVKRGKAGKIYNEHEAVHVMVNKVGPFNNPTETYRYSYRYYSLPFCHEHSTEQEEEEVAAVENVDLPNFPKVEKQKPLGALRQLGEYIVSKVRSRERSPYKVSYGDTFDFRLLCMKKLLPKDLVAFKEAIHNDYAYEMFVEDLSMWGYIGDTRDEDLIVGEVTGSKTYLYPHLHFYLGHNKNKIVAAKVTTDMDRRVDITDVTTPQEVMFSYSVEWYE